MKPANLSQLSLFLLVGLMAPSQQAIADALSGMDGLTKVQPSSPFVVKAFRLQDVRVSGGPFRKAQELDEAYLLTLNVDRLLHNFRVNAGLPSSATPLGGWEEPNCELRGHFVGHYLSACALMYASTGDSRFKDRGDAVVSGLAECQAKLGTGYLSAFPESFIDRVEKPSQVWAPYYTLHKILAGLLDMYEYCGNQQALVAARKFGDWVVQRNGRLSEAQMQTMLGTEHGGMNEGLANLFVLTGERKYLEMSLRFNHHRVLDPAAAYQDKLTGLHANTQIPKFIGNAAQYEFTGDDALRRASLFFWNTVVRERSYVIGGHSDGEMFSPKEKLSQALGPNTTETCNTYNMLKLTRHLFCWEPRVEYADYYERALCNHILASQNPETGMMCYYVPLRSGSRKNYNGTNDSFWCCTGTGIENHAKYADSIYFHGDNDLYVNLFIPSELNWPQKGLKLRQETNFPDEGASKLLVSCSGSKKFTLHLRHPAWATASFSVRVNGKSQPDHGPSSWVDIDRTWKNGDAVDIVMPFSLRTEAFKDNTNRLAFLNGPLVLSAEVDMKKPCPAIVADGNVLAGLTKSGKAANTFTANRALFRIPGATLGEPVTLEPFYKVHGARHYVVYWDRFTPGQWQSREKEYTEDLARRKELEARTIDYINPGEEQNERDHKMKGEKTNSGDFGDRKYRDANEGGWFAWELKVLPDVPQQLSVTYWGEDRGRVFDVLVDGQKLATQRLVGAHPGKFYEELYELPPALIADKSQITLKIQGATNSWAGGVFGVRVLKTKGS